MSPRPLEPARRYLLIACVIVMDFLAGTELDLFVPSFPQIERAFSLEPFWVEALLSVNFVTFCTGLIFVGDLSDRFGRKPVLVVSLILFCVGSVLCFTAPTYALLFLGRACQGLGISAPAVVSFLLVADHYSLDAQQRLFALLGGVMNISVGLAPVIGSYLALAFGWRGSFGALLCLGALSLIMVLFCVPTYGVDAPARTRTPLWQGYMALFHHKDLMQLVRHFMVQFTPYWIFVGMAPLFYMDTLCVPLSQYGFHQGSLATVYALGSFLFAALARPKDHVRLLRVSYILFGFGTLCALAACWTTNALLVTLAMMPFICGQIVPSALLYPQCLSLIPDAKGKVSALLQGGRLIFSALMLQIASALYQKRFLEIALTMAVFMIASCVTLRNLLQKRTLF